MRVSRQSPEPRARRTTLPRNTKAGAPLVRGLSADGGRGCCRSAWRSSPRAGCPFPGGHCTRKREKFHMISGTHLPSVPPAHPQSVCGGTPTPGQGCARFSHSRVRAAIRRRPQSEDRPKPGVPSDDLHTQVSLFLPPCHSGCHNTHCGLSSGQDLPEAVGLPSQRPNYRGQRQADARE